MSAFLSDSVIAKAPLSFLSPEGRSCTLVQTCREGLCAAAVPLVVLQSLTGKGTCKGKVRIISPR